MTAVPFGSSEAEVVSENDDSTRTWRYEDNGAGGILYAGDYVREDIEAGGMTIQFYYGRKHQSVMEAAGAVDAVKAGWTTVRSTTASCPSAAARP